MDDVTEKLVDPRVNNVVRPRPLRVDARSELVNSDGDGDVEECDGISATFDEVQPAVNRLTADIILPSGAVAVVVLALLLGANLSRVGSCSPGGSS